MIWTDIAAVNSRRSTIKADDECRGNHTPYFVVDFHFVHSQQAYVYFTGLWTLSGIFADKQCPKQLISANQNKEKENYSCCSCGLFFPFSYHTIRYNHVGRQNRTCAHVPVFHWGELEQNKGLSTAHCGCCSFDWAPSGVDTRLDTSKFEFQPASLYNQPVSPL